MVGAGGDVLKPGVALVGNGLVGMVDPERAGHCVKADQRDKALKIGFVEMAKQMGIDAGMVDMIPIPESTTTTVAVFKAATLQPVQVEKRVVGGGSSSMMSMLSGSTSVTTYSWK